MSRMTRLKTGMVMMVNVCAVKLSEERKIAVGGDVVTYRSSSYMQILPKLG